MSILAQPIPASRSPLSREAQLLILVAGGAANEPTTIKPLGNLDWPKLAFLAQQEGATAILWQWLQRTGTNGMPRDVATHWQKRAMVAAFQMLHLERLLHDVLDVLAAHGIDAMLLKGSALAYTVYGSFSERPMGDIDLLVRPERAEEAWSLLQARGWRWLSGQLPLERYTTHQHLPPLTSSRGGDGVLEIHAQILPGGHPFRWPVDAVWAAARRMSTSGRPITVPHPLHQLLHVCLHFAWSHEMQWGSWRMLRDVEALTRRGNVAWTRFVQMAHDTRAATCCYWTLRLARNLAGAAVPDDVLRALRPPRPEFVLTRLEDHYVRQLFSTEGACPSELLCNALWKFGIAPRWSRHGPARPWQVAERWTAALDQQPVPAGWVRQFLERTRHAALAIRYLGRITAPSGRFRRAASGSPTTRSVP